MDLGPRRGFGEEDDPRTAKVAGEKNRAPKRKKNPTLVDPSISMDELCPVKGGKKTKTRKWGTRTTTPNNDPVLVNNKLDKVVKMKKNINKDGLIATTSLPNNDKLPKKKMLTGKDALMCHQCQRNDKGRVVWCHSCKRKRYCAPCIKKWYPHSSEAEFGKKCPFCRNNCNCKMRLRMKGVAKLPEKNLNKSDIIRHSYHVLHFLLPWLKETLQDQMLEKEVEAKIKGLKPAELKLKKAVYENDERLYCNNCKTSIFDFHRSCPNPGCSYDLCLACCRELREGCVPGGDETPMPEYNNRGREYLHGGSHRLKILTCIS